MIMIANIQPSWKDQVNAAIVQVENETGAIFAGADNPLLLSVRSGARASMPGMMDTVLNLGLNSETVAGLAKRSGDKRFAWDSFRRFIQMYSDVVLGVDHGLFEDALEDLKAERNVIEDTDLDGNDCETLVKTYLDIVREEAGVDFPEDPHEQLWGAIGAVFGSWMNARAITYRKLNNIPAEWGTAVNIQAMVFGNMGDNCATGVAFTRNPSTGENAFYGEFLINAQGEDVVAGIRTPRNLTAWKDSKVVWNSYPWKKPCQRYLINSVRCGRCWKPIIGICRILSSPFSRTSFICCKPVRGNAPLKPRCGWRWKWLKKN